MISRLVQSRRRIWIFGWIIRNKIDITEQLNLDKYFIDEEVRIKIKRLLKVDMQDLKKQEENMKYCYSEWVWAYDRISTLQNVIKGLNKEIKKAKESADNANKYINTILLSNQQKNKNDKMAVKLQCKQNYEYRLKKIQEAFNKEIQNVMKQSNEHRIEAQMKDKILSKITEVVIEQEFVLYNIKRYYKRKFGLTRLKSFSEYRNNLLNQMDELVVNRLPVDFKNESIKSIYSKPSLQS